MLQDNDSNGSSEEFSNLMEPAEHEADASAGELADMSSSTLKADTDESFLGKVRTNVTNMISKLFGSPKGEANSTTHDQQSQVENIARASNDEIHRMMEQRKRKHSPSVSPSGSGDHYAEMIRKRSRLNVPTEAITQPGNTPLVNRLSRESTPNVVQLRASFSEIRRRPLSRSAAGRFLQTRRAVTQSLCGRTLADRSVNRSLSIGEGHRTSPWAVPSDLMPYGNETWQSEISNGHDSVPDCAASTPRSTNSLIEEEIDSASVTSEEQQHPDGADNLSQFAAGDRVEEPYVPFGNQQKYEAALKAANDPSRRYSTFLGNAFARNRSRCGSASNLNFWSHLDHGKSLFRSGPTYERPAFNPSVYSNSSFTSYFYEGVPRYGGASAVPFNQSRINGFRTPLPPKRRASETVVGSTMISTQSQIIQTILDSYSTQNAEKRRREANDLMRQEKTLMEKTRQLLESRIQTGSGVVRLRKPATQPDLISQRLHNATINNELLVPRMQQMMAISLLQQTTTARKCIASQPVQGTLPPQEYATKRQTVSDEQTAETPKRGCGEASASNRQMDSPVVPIELPNFQLPEVQPPNMLHYSIGSIPCARSVPAKPSKRLSTPDTATAQHSVSVGGSPEDTVSNTPTYTNKPAVSDTVVRRNGHLFMFSCPDMLEPAVNGTSVIGQTSYKFSGPQLLTRMIQEPPSFKQIISSISAGNKWLCDVCSVWSEQSATKCVACESPKPQPKATAPSSFTTHVNECRPSSFQQLIAATSAGNKWQCDVCSVWSEQSATKCVACESPKPQPKATAPSSFTTHVNECRPPSFQQLIAATSAGNKWQCDVCSVWSEQNATKCVACESPKPQPKATAPSSFTTHFYECRPPSFQQLIAATSAGNKWQCDVCSVWSEQSATKCVACESPKPQPKVMTSSASARKLTSLATSNSTTCIATICQPLPSINPLFDTTVHNGPPNATELIAAQQPFSRSNGPSPKPMASTASAIITISDESDDDGDSECEVVTGDLPVITTGGSTLPFGIAKNGTAEYDSGGIHFRPADQLVITASHNNIAGAKRSMALDGSNGNNCDRDGDKFQYDHKKAFDNPVFHFGSQPQPSA
uniref:Nuclear pore complex protein Nup153 n=1 Tax=Anopheles atroparvus TaxID=41427 RepID=A0AAG5DQ24_ANOAO